MRLHGKCLAFCNILSATSCKNWLLSSFIINICSTRLSICICGAVRVTAASKLQPPLHLFYTLVVGKQELVQTSKEIPHPQSSCQAEDLGCRGSSSSTPHSVAPPTHVPPPPPPKGLQSSCLAMFIVLKPGQASWPCLRMPWWSCAMGHIAQSACRWSTALTAWRAC